MGPILKALVAFITGFLKKPEPLPIPNPGPMPEPVRLPQSPAEPQPAPNTETSAPKPVAAPVALQWDTQKQAYHSTRVICDEYFPLTRTMPVYLKDGTYLGKFMPKDVLCAMTYQESRFRKGAIGALNSNGTQDYGLLQFNNGKINGKALWIGPGAAFKDINEVLTDPEKNVRVAAKTCKAGGWKLWSSYKYNDHAQWLKPDSPMWALGK